MKLIHKQAAHPTTGVVLAAFHFRIQVFEKVLKKIKEGLKVANILKETPKLSYLIRDCPRLQTTLIQNGEDTDVRTIHQVADVFVVEVIDLK